MNSKTIRTRSSRQLVIREIIEDDIAEIEGAFERDEFAIDDMFLETLIANPEYGQRMIVASMDNQIVGKLRISFSQFDVATAYSDNIGFLKDLQVLPEFQHDGVASALIEYAEGIVKEEGKHYAGLRIVWDNPRPLKLCLRAGYREMYMELPDAFDLYKDLRVASEEMSDDEVRRAAQDMIIKAQALCETQNMSASFSWR